MCRACGYTTGELVERGLDKLPDELVSNTHLVYSSPATLAYNSPGAEGFGVKRAGLAIPGSIMLIVAPGCCGRNTSIVSEMRAYDGRFFYLTMDTTDIVTGRHLKRIPEAVSTIVSSLSTPPSVVMICITCVDALLGTDMERVSKKCEEATGVPVRPCYMYALTREGRRPPMVHVRQSLYSMLEPLPKRGTSVNVLGYFAPLESDCELFGYLASIGVKNIRQVGAAKDFDDFLHMAEANFNLVLNPEARLAAADFEKRLGIPSIELVRLHDPDRIHSQYVALGKVLGTSFDDTEDLERALKVREDFKTKYPDLTFALGECANADPFELALSLTRAGFSVREVFGTITSENEAFVKRLADVAPDLMVYSNMEPTMIRYDPTDCPVDVCVGKDACYYHPEAAHVSWNQDVQPFGYTGMVHLFEALDEALAAHAMREA
jgi:nitrogenase molybdenum-cofactor synthesis protein NifE